MNPLSLYLVSSCFKIPHPSKFQTGGEDACFVSQFHNAIGVSDGVGGWTTVRGSDSAKYSRDLMSFSKMYANLSNPKDMVKMAFEKLDKSVIGSATVTTAKLNGTKMLFYNLGDSGCGLYRDFTHVFHTPVQQYGFNFPYQLGYKSQSTPDDGTNEYVVVESGDVVVCASDGLWDNMYQRDIEKILNKVHSYAKEPLAFAKHAAKKLASVAMINGADESFDSPFAMEARKNGLDYIGGKLDDTTVVVGIVCEH